jgi:multiple sugar transport system substrate-binding protein
MVSGTKISRRSFLGLSGITAAGLALAACQPVMSGQGAHGSSNVKLVYQDWRTEWFPGLAQRELGVFQKTHPNISVFYTPDPENFDQQMEADMLSGTAADIIDGCCDHFPIWAQKGYLLDLRPYIQADLDSATINDWDKAQYQALSTRTGVQYALPKYHGALALFYNKDLFDFYHVDYPNDAWTHDDYLNAMRALTKDRNNDGKTDLWGSMVDISWERIQVHVNGWGGHFVDPQDPTRSLMAKSEAMTAMEWIRARMWDDHVMASALDVEKLDTRTAFIQQRVAMVEDGSWALKDILEKAPFRIGVTTFPAGPVRKVTLASTDGFAIYAGTKYPEAAWELMKFLISPEYGLAMAKSQLLQPARKSLVDQWVQLIQEQYPNNSKEMDLSAFARGQAQGYSVTAEVFANMKAAQTLISSTWDQIFTLGQAGTDLIAQTSARIEAAQHSNS